MAATRSHIGHIGRKRAFVALAAALVGAVLATTGIAVWTLASRESTSAEPTREPRWPSAEALAAMEAVRKHAALLLSYDFRTFDQHAEAALEVTTGRFRNEFKRIHTELREQVMRMHASVRTEIIDAGVLRMADGDVEVLLFATVYVRNDTVSGERTEEARVKMTVRQVDERWLVTAMDAI